MEYGIIPVNELCEAWTLGPGRVVRWCGGSDDM
jgi:hypothetical protein